MAHNMLKKGFIMKVYDRSKEALSHFPSSVVCSSLKELGLFADCLILCLPNTDIIHQVQFFPPILLLFVSSPHAIAHTPRCFLGMTPVTQLILTVWG